MSGEESVDKVTEPPKEDVSKDADRQNSNHDIPEHREEVLQNEGEMPNEGQDGSRIGYRTEYRHAVTNDLIDQSYSTKDPDAHLDEAQLQKEKTAFEIVRVCRTMQKDSAATAGPSRHGLSASSTSMHILSIAIINALRSVVRYYPGQELANDIVIVDYPYPILVHHYDELSEFRRRCSEKESRDLCIRERNAREDLGILLDYLDKTIMPGVREGQERNRRNLWKWDWSWVRMKPGATLLSSTMKDRKPEASVVHSIRGGSFLGTNVWEIKCWSLDWDGNFLGRRMRTIRWSKSVEKELSANLDMIQMEDMALPDTKMVSDLIDHGTVWWSLLPKKCKHHKGRTETFPYNEVDGTVMTDLRSYYAQAPGQRPILEIAHSSRWVSDCNCTICSQRRKREVTQIPVPFDGYDLITPEFFPHLSPHQYLLCPYETRGFVFKTRTWEQLHVRNLSEPQFREDMIDHLVMDERRVGTLKTLAKSFAGLNVHGKRSEREPWSADFVAGKGTGLIFLLHGSPGVGKTYTAECIAAYTKRPLMILTASDIGTDPEDVEFNLAKNFKTARIWNAVLLIDEADVFMERRSTADLNRNSLVAGFLRALEFYDGILFLTTNRVGTFDDAFVSRVHVKLYYPEFTPEQRRRVWQTFVDKLAEERGDYIRVHIGADEYLDGKEMLETDWDGREIRNAFQTAVSLAEYDDERDKEGTILVKEKHLKAVVELSRDFKEYLDELHVGDEGKRAERNFDRLHSYKGR